MASAVREWLALRRVHAGGVTRLGDSYLNFGCRVPSYLADEIDNLIGRGLLALGQPDPIGQRWVCVTHAGQARYAELCSTQGGTGGR